MSRYTSTREGFQEALNWSLNGLPEEARLYAEATTIPSFHEVVNGKELSYDDFVKGIAEWREKVTDYKATLHEFLRDGDQLAARVTGTMMVGEANVTFEAFIFAKIDKESGKMVSLVERSVSGPVGQEPEHGVN